MDLSQHKITQEERTTLGVVALADRPEMAAQTLKERFDALVNKTADKFNETVDDLQHVEDDYNVWEAREQGRVDAESSRVTAEQGRVNAETARAAAEAARADFVTGSVATAKAEADRAKAEADRASAIVGGDYMTRTEVGAAVAAHNSAGDAHADIRAEVAGKATLGADGKVPVEQLPAMNYEPTGTAAAAVAAHNSAGDAHADMRAEVTAETAARAAEIAAHNASSSAHADIIAPINSKLSELTSRAKIATGSYIGTGTGGVGNPTVLSFPFIPQIIILHPRQTGNEASLTAIFIKDSTLAYPFTSNAYSYAITNLQWNTTVKFYATGGQAIYQFNEASKTYDYVALA